MTCAEVERRFREEVANIRSAIFYWMTRNHRRGEQSYAELGSMKERLTEALKAYDDAVEALPATAGWRHKKRGTTYTIVGRAEIQGDQYLVDGAEVVVYQADHDGKLWVRHVDEFNDGRFERISSPPDDGGRG